MHVPWFEDVQLAANILRVYNANFAHFCEKGCLGGQPEFQTCDAGREALTGQRVALCGTALRPAQRCVGSTSVTDPIYLATDCCAAISAAPSPLGSGMVSRRQPIVAAAMVTRRATQSVCRTIKILLTKDRMQLRAK